jgi:MFS family permease
MLEISTTSIEFQSNWKAKFFTIWSGQALSLVGSALVQFALVWWLTVETGSATVLAMASLVALLPQIVLSPFVGALVDRWNRRLVMIVADAARGLCRSACGRQTSRSAKTAAAPRAQKVNLFTNICLQG